MFPALIKAPSKKIAAGFQTEQIMISPGAPQVYIDKPHSELVYQYFSYPLVN